MADLLGPLDDLNHAPALGRRERTGLHDQHAVADADLVGRIVRLELAGTTNDLAVERVLDPVLDGDDHGLIHLVADHEPLAGLAVRRAGGCLCARLGHATSPSFGATDSPSSRSRRIV